MPSFRTREVLGQGILGALVGAMSVLLFADRRTPAPPPASVGPIALGVGVLIGALFVAGTLLVRRRTGPDALRQALRTGRLPDDVDDATLGRLLRQRSERLLGYRWAWPALAALQTLVGVVQLLGHHSTPYGAIAWSADIALWVGAAVAFAVIARRDAPTTVRLLEELDGRAAARSQDRSASS